MPIYLYKAKKGLWEIIEGRVEAQTQAEAAGKVDALGLFLIAIEEQKDSFKRSVKISLKDLAAFSRQLSTLINSGSNLLFSLTTIVSETGQDKLKPVLLDIISQVKDGQRFSQALDRYPNVFSQLYISLVRTGEASGTLGENLERISQFLEDEIEFKSNMFSILIYPLSILAVGLLTIVVLFNFVIPRIVKIFDEMGQSLPLPTLLLKNVSSVFSKYWLIILVSIFLMFLLLKKYLAQPRNKLKWHKYRLSMPLLGELFKKIEISRFSRTLAILLRNGVALDISLKVVSATVTNIFFRKQVENIEKDIREGLSLNKAMKKIKMFPPAFINIITIGEESAALERVLGRLCADYDKEINRKIKNLLSILEPVLILTMGLVVVFVVASMLLPIFEIDFNF